MHLPFAMSRLLFTLLAAVAGAVVGAVPATTHITEHLVTEALDLQGSPQEISLQGWPHKRRAFAAAVIEWSKATLTAEQGTNASASSPRPDPRYGYFRFIPQYLGSVVGTTRWQGVNRCFKQNSLSATRRADGALTLEFKFKGKTSWLAGCSDTYVPTLGSPASPRPPTTSPANLSHVCCLIVVLVWFGSGPGEAVLCGLVWRVYV